ncbi:MAG: zinc ribbon domain-containing protein [Pseudomonadota bacterium]|nr:zinc ribbon domain-containing protein [Pseudomonadota bacterium]
MPIYEYRCNSCSAELEKLQKISDPPLVQCPECGKDALVKLVSASSFRLKGSGWYETDFKTGKKKNGVGDADKSGGSATPDSAKADSGAATGSAAADGKDVAAANKSAATESKSSGTNTASKSAPKE